MTLLERSFQDDGQNQVKLGSEVVVAKLQVFIKVDGRGGGGRFSTVLMFPSMLRISQWNYFHNENERIEYRYSVLCLRHLQREKGGQVGCPVHC